MKFDRVAFAALIAPLVPKDTVAAVVELAEQAAKQHAAHENRFLRNTPTQPTRGDVSMP